MNTATATKGTCRSKLDPRAQAQGALPSLLEQVVGQPDGSRAEGQDEHHQAGHRLAGEDQVGDEGRDQDEYAAHRGRALLRAMPLGGELADVLADSAAAAASG